MAGGRSPRRRSCGTCGAATRSTTAAAAMACSTSTSGERGPTPSTSPPSAPPSSGSVAGGVRTSSGMFLRRGRDKIIGTIDKRIDYTFIPVENGGGLQVLHYEAGQKYEPHFDYFHDDFNTKNGAQRIATLLMYLSDVEEGGETVFPSAPVNSSASPFYNELFECAKRGLSVKPKMGDALLFWSMKPDGSLDPTSLHGGCPVIKGNKWSSTK